MTTTPDRCPASARLHTSPGPGWYQTVSPFEHFDSARTQRFPHTCRAAEIAGGEPVVIAARPAPASYPAPYNAFTRERGELYVYGGYVAQGTGAYVARLDPASLAEEWRYSMRSSDPLHWNYPGVGGALGNGWLAAVAGNILARVDAGSGAGQSILLPQHPGEGGAAYNGYVVSPDGVIFTKSIERGHPCDKDEAGGLECVVKNKVPSFLVAVDSASLKILASVETPETILGRISAVRLDGVDSIFCPGLTHVWRYLFRGGRLELDPQWGPVPYVQGREQPGTGTGVLHDWVVVQTNFLPAAAPLKVFAMNIRDSRRVFAITPFPTSKLSEELSKAALDLDTMRVYSGDRLVGRTVAFSFDPQKGFAISWTREQAMDSFWALAAPPSAREAIGTDTVRGAGDHAVWVDAATGREIARSGVLDSQGNGSVISPGFDGRFYYMAQSKGQVIELTPVRAQ